MRSPVDFEMRPDSVPSANVTRLFSVKPTSIKFKELRLPEGKSQYSLTFTVDCSVPVIASVFVKVKETLDKAHDITSEYVVLTKTHLPVRNSPKSPSFSTDPSPNHEPSTATLQPRSV